MLTIRYGLTHIPALRYKKWRDSSRAGHRRLLLSLFLNLLAFFATPDSRPFDAYPIVSSISQFKCYTPLQSFSSHGECHAIELGPSCRRLFIIFLGRGVPCLHSENSRPRLSTPTINSLKSGCWVRSDCFRPSSGSTAKGRRR